MAKYIVACVDGSPTTSAVCDMAAWTSKRLATPLALLNVIERNEANQDASQNSELQDKMEKLDLQRAELQHEHAKEIMKKATERIKSHDVEPASQYIEEGGLVEALDDLDDEIRLVIVGKNGHSSLKSHLGSHLEKTIRVVHRPLLVVQEAFEVPKRVMLAFDGRVSTVKGVRLIAESPLFSGIPCDVVMVGGHTDEHKEQLQWAVNLLQENDIPAESFLLKNDAHISDALIDHIQSHDIGLLAMGAYGHTRLRQWLVGSTTTNVLLKSQCAMLILR
ncbi:universal stress protein [Halomonas sp. SpR1]|uniref:universal stress protein n=1 Tax=Halomonas sp. SpR1 TaxID=3050462 RepID=UPI0027E4BA52|nr:universal stress protein [Halomonas sp. SpR1]MDQ7732208.1 universal stress protein [Halomonas sp. SpR1]